MTEFKAPLPPGNFKAPPMAPVSPTAPSQQPPAAPVAPSADVQPMQPTQVQPAQQTVSQTNLSEVVEPADEQNGAEGKSEIQDAENMPGTAALSSKKNILFLAGAFVVGLLLGGLMFGGSSAPKEPETPRTLPGVVSNPDIRGQKLKRCGQVDASETCILYVMNDKTYDKRAQDFFETAVALTNRSEFSIKSVNVQYGTIRIPPGFFAELKIPPYGR